MMTQQASKQLAVLMVCAVFRHIWQNCEEQLLASLCVCVHRSAWNSSAATGHIFMEFDIWAICEITWKNMVEPDRPQMTK
jgi:hypothetical protein